MLPVLATFHQLQHFACGWRQPTTDTDKRPSSPLRKRSSSVQPAGSWGQTGGQPSRKGRGGLADTSVRDQGRGPETAQLRQEGAGVHSVPAAPPPPGCGEWGRRAGSWLPAVNMRALTRPVLTAPERRKHPAPCLFIAPRLPSPRNRGNQAEPFGKWFGQPGCGDASFQGRNHLHGHQGPGGLSLDGKPAGAPTLEPRWPQAPGTRCRSQC